MEKEIVNLPESRHLAQRLLAYEARCGQELRASGVLRLFRRLCEAAPAPHYTRGSLPVFRSLLARALTLARAEAPSLSAVQGRGGMDP